MNDITFSSVLYIVKCPVLVAPPNTMTAYTSQMENEVTVTYTCEPGFGLVGNPVRTCLPGNNTWTGDEPHCQRKSRMSHLYTIRPVN